MTDNGRESLVIVPARLAATRLPDKPLATIAGAPMIVHVWRRAVEADIGPVIVACGDRAIADAVEAAGGEAVMTDPDLPSGSDRGPCRRRAPRSRRPASISSSISRATCRRSTPP